jgi:hypothetical protein
MIDGSPRDAKARCYWELTSAARLAALGESPILFHDT